MLSDRDRRALERLERELVTKDPDLARRMRQRHRTRQAQTAWRVAVAAVGVALAVMLLTLGLVGQAFLVLLILWWPLVVRLLRRRSGNHQVN